MKTALASSAPSINIICLLLLFIIIRLTLKAFAPQMARNLHDKDDHIAKPSSVGNTKTLSSVI